ncbi:2-hydroxyacid dehydrogenase [Alsobacter sp. R-9]
MAEPLVIARLSAGETLARDLAAWGGAGLRVSIVPEHDDTALQRVLPQADALLHVLKPVDAALFAAAPRLRLVQKIGVGVNTIDLDAARRYGVAVCNMPGVNTPAVAEMTLGLMLAVLRRIPALDGAARTPGGWSPGPGAEEGFGEIAGRTVGLVGAGAVARRLAVALGALGAEVVCWSRTERPDMPARFVPWPTLLGTSDIVSLHVPLVEATSGLMNRQAFAAMKPGAILVNTARGGLVDETALIDALTSGRLAGAGLDVLGEEPPPADHRLLARQDVVLAPHMAWLTPETWRRALAVALDNVCRLRDGLPLLNRVA